MSSTISRFGSPKVIGSVRIIALVIALGSYIAWTTGFFGFEESIMSIALMIAVLSQPE